MNTEENNDYKEDLYDDNTAYGNGGICPFIGRYCAQVGSNVCERCIENTIEQDDE